MLKNGGEISDYQRNYPLRGGKTTVFEGGQRVRAFIYAQNLDIDPYVYNGMFHSVDWIPTVINAALPEPIGTKKTYQAKIIQNKNSPQLCKIEILIIKKSLELTA